MARPAGVRANSSIGAATPTSLPTRAIQAVVTARADVGHVVGATVSTAAKMAGANAATSPIVRRLNGRQNALLMSATRIASLIRAHVNALALALIERDDAARDFGVHFMDRYESNAWSPSRLISIPAAAPASRIKVTLRWLAPGALDLSAMRLEAESAPTDITITCGAWIFNSHRALFVQGSAFFRGMFSSGMAESGGAVALQGVDSTLLEHALTFFYNSACTLRQDGLLDLLQMSMRLQMHDLSRAVLGAVGNRLHAGNWMGALSLAGELGLPELASLAKQFAVSTFGMQLVSDTPTAPRLELDDGPTSEDCAHCSYSVVEGYPKPVTGADGDVLQLFKVGCDRGVSFAQAKAYLDQRRPSLSGRLRQIEGFYCSRRWRMGQTGVYGHFLILNATDGWSIIRPATGWGEKISDQDRSMEDFLCKIRKLPSEEAATGWDARWMGALRSCVHGPHCSNRAFCCIGKRVQWQYMLSGFSTHEYWHILKRHGSSCSLVLKDRKRAREGPWLCHLEFGGHSCVAVGIRFAGDLPPEEVMSSWLSGRSHEWKENDFPIIDALFGSWPL